MNANKKKIRCKLIKYSEKKKIKKSCLCCKLISDDSLRILMIVD